MLFLDTLYKALDLPIRIVLFLKNRLMGKSKFSTTRKSDSDSTSYTDFVSVVVRDDKKLARFRKNLSKVGSPRVYYYPQLGWISPTVIRYLYVNQRILDLFSSKGVQKVGEIGIGFGGQFAITSKSMRLTEYSMYDLPVVLSLSERTLGNANLLNGSFKQQSIDPVIPNSFDLVISNYAFSELPAEVQRDYISKIFKNTPCGYLTMNSGRSDVTGRSFGKVSLAEIKAAIPSCEILEEDPITGPDNYIIVWGHQVSE